MRKTTLLYPILKLIPLLLLFVILGGIANAQCSDPFDPVCQQQALCEGCWAAARESCYLAGQMSDYLYAWCVLYYGYFCTSYGCHHTPEFRQEIFAKYEPQPVDRRSKRQFYSVPLYGNA